MRLFHTQVTLLWETLQINEDRVLKHARVLRLKEGDKLAVQQQEGCMTTRWSWEIVSISKSIIECKIHETEVMTHAQGGPWMLIWLPHTQEKLHLIVQKLTECWIQDIVFRKNDRSQGFDVSVKKMSKLCKISLESIEQSNGWRVPNISQVDNIHERVVWKELVLFDFEWEDFDALQWIPKDRLYGVVWPEGHFSPRDYETIGFQVVKKIALGESILRTETAAIVGGWLLKNSKL